VRLVAGVDEVGRGPLAGPVVAAAVILDPARPVEGLADSKTLARAERERLAGLIRHRALAVGLGMADAAEIDRLNILGATHLAMRRALLALRVRPTHVEIDGNRPPKLTSLGFTVTCECFVKGDASRSAIAAASIVAKVWRDAWMGRADGAYPLYGFRSHAGYGTPAHRRAIREHGPCLLHRRSFEPVKSLR
jgi:ribonuclease HII